VGLKKMKIKTRDCVSLSCPIIASSTAQKWCCLSPPSTNVRQDQSKRPHMLVKWTRRFVLRNGARAEPLCFCYLLTTRDSRFFFFFATSTAQPLSLSPCFLVFLVFTFGVCFFRSTQNSS
jgi:hypothetical protein